MDPTLGPSEVIDHARRVEALGYDGLQISETVHDSLALALLVAEHTSTIIIRTSVTVAFIRSPTLVAYSTWDLAKFSNGRFQLGLGTQIRQNIEDRFGMTWSTPSDHMRDYLGALDALFACFSSGGAIDFRSEHYTLTRMQPYFNPGPDLETKPPPIFLGGVNSQICQLAGERAQGFVTHPTNSSPRYLESSCLPDLRSGMRRVAREDPSFELVCGTQVITGSTRREIDAERDRQRRLLAFLYSTPAYRPTLDLYGWGELSERLGQLISQDRWNDLSALVTDEILDALIPSAPFESLAELLGQRFAHLAQGITLTPPAQTDHDARFAEVIAALQAYPSASFSAVEP